MKELITDQLTSAGYDEIDDDVFMDAAKRDFWVIEHKLGTFTKNDIYELAGSEKIKTLYRTYIGAEKCTSVIFLEETDTPDPKHEEQIEDDPFNFKKYVIQYTAQDVEELKNNMTAFDDLEETASKSHMFERLTQNPESTPGYVKLLYKTARKLPFITVRTQQCGFPQYTPHVPDTILEKQLINAMMTDGISHNKIVNANRETLTEITKHIIKHTANEQQ